MERQVENDNAEDGLGESPPDYWSFAMHYNMLKSKKVKSRLGRRRVNEQSSNSKDSNTSCETDIRSLKNENFRDLNTPLTHPQTQSKKDVSFDSSYQMLGIKNDKALESRETQPELPFQRKLFGNMLENQNTSRNESFNKKNSTVNSSTSDAGNDSFFTAQITQHVDKSVGFGCFSLKTPGKQLARFKISDSPIDPLAGIFNEDSDSWKKTGNAQKSLQFDLFSEGKTLQDLNQDKFSDFKQSKSDIFPLSNNTPIKNNDYIFKKPLITDSLSKNEKKQESIFKQPVVPEHKNFLNLSIEKHVILDDIHSGLNSTPQSLTKSKSTNNFPFKTAINTSLGKENAFFQPKYEQKIINGHTDHIYVNNVPYRVLTLLGKGGSSEVFQVLGPKSNLLAIKCVNLASAEESIAKGYLNEIELLLKLQGCPSVISMFDHEFFQNTKMLYVVMEIGDIDFSKLIKNINQTKKVSMPMIIYYWTEILHAVKAIHEQGIIHSDLKPANFLLVNGRLKLIDFGIASLQGDMTSVLKDVTAGTFNYISPEAITTTGEGTGYKITYKSDIWSLGCILYNLLYGKTPFSHLTQPWAKMQAIADPNIKITYPQLSTEAPLTLMLSLRLCLLKDPKARPTASELLQISDYSPFSDRSLGKYIRQSMCEQLMQNLPNLNKIIAQVIHEIGGDKKN